MKTHQSLQPKTRNLLISASLILTILQVGCATTAKPDPIESVNRQIFKFNDAVDDAVLAPVARKYTKYVPLSVRESIGNFFKNPKDISSAINQLLQGRPVDALSDLGRFGTNSTIGVLGLFDVAKKMGMERHGEDFGQTLGYWGFGPGPYVVLPLLGSSTLRDAATIPAEGMLPSFGVVTLPLEVTHTRSTFLSANSMLDDVALDRYLFVRDAHLQRRQSLVVNGNVEIKKADTSKLQNMDANGLAHD